MMIRKCCDYTLKETCNCGKKTRTAHPMKFSDRYAKYRRIAKKERVSEQGV